LFDPAFLKYLSRLQLSLDVDAVPEGTVVFPHEPLLRVRGPILQAQLVETALLNLVNSQALIATRAARVVWAAKGDPVLEFGLRRAQGIDGGLAASWASYVGGCAATSTALAARLYGIPVRAIGGRCARLLERARGPPLRHPRARHPCPQLGDVLRRRRRGVPRLRGG